MKRIKKNHRFHRKAFLITFVIWSSLICLLLHSEPYLSFEENDQSGIDDLTIRQLSRYLLLNYGESYEEYRTSSLFYSGYLALPGRDFRFYPFETRVIRNVLPDLGFFREPLNNLIDYIPYEEYYQFIDQYYLRDLPIVTFGDRARLKINFNDLVQGDYFMKLNIDLYRARRERR